MDLEKKSLLIALIKQEGGQVYGQDLARKIEEKKPEWSAKTINRDLYRLAKNGDLIAKRGHFKVREWCPLTAPVVILNDSDKAFSKGCA